MSSTAVDALNTALRTLHDTNFVLGDLREPNTMIQVQVENSAQKGCHACRFDCAMRKARHGTHPSDINLDTGMVRALVVVSTIDVLSISILML